MIYNIYIFNKSGVCIYYEEWNRKKPSSNLAEEQKLLFGMLYSLKSFLSKSSPRPMDPSTAFHCFKTTTYKLHFYETLSSVKFIILTDPNTPDLRDELKKVYSTVFIDYVIKNPLYEPNSIIKCELFITHLNQMIKQIPYYNI
ncbi:hypothetical protein SAMD00019534_121830, partial [Acytostelium subglobosum LB1]|uniref:hypothetical protein n=1 Tax=Acytostelium subglobosum LB1 TaxID=1410327 RepID=UPI000644C5E2